MVNFCTIASGSSGNSVYIGTTDTHILIDAGVSGKRLQDGLKEINLTGNDIDAIFITHEHRDHVAGAGVLSRKFNIPIYATMATWDEMQESIGEVPHGKKRFIYKGENCVVNDICVRPFEIPHDAVEPVGYNVFADRFKISIATDIGHVNDSLIDDIKDSNVLLLESNHDVDMLKTGSYHYNLKQRILGRSGHLSNVSAGNLLVKLMNENLQHVFLGHLSRDNNTPDIAYGTVKGILNENNIKVGTYLKLKTAAAYGVADFLELS